MLEKIFTDILHVKWYNYQNCFLVLFRWSFVKCENQLLYFEKRFFLFLLLALAVIIVAEDAKEKAEQPVLQVLSFNCHKINVSCQM